MSRPKKSEPQKQSDSITKMVLHGMAEAGIKNITQLAAECGIERRTLSRRMTDGNQFTAGELFKLRKVIPIQIEEGFK